MCIYHIERSTRYSPLTDEVFTWLEGIHSTAITSTITMTELLVHPYQQKDQTRIDAFYSLLSTYPHLT